ncbi:MAG TPA: hypothetical protein VMT28_03105 [Terriglobales bacterium]|jgi:hypothetical protein|nr:hypothetical protein [Terriglobales bacterium]
MKSTSVFLAAILCALPLYSAQNEKPIQTDNSQRYLVLDTVRTKTLQRELEEASATGYRVAYGDPSHNILILEKTPEKYQYRVLQGLKDEFKAAVAEGFCAVPATFSSDYMKARALIMERPAGASKVHDYVLLDTVRTKTLQKELNEAAAKGYELAAMSSYGANNILMEKLSPEAPAAPDRYLLLATTRTSTMQKEINDAVAKGYAVAAGSGGEEILLIMERTAKAPEYLLLATVRMTTLEKEINEAATRGFRPLPRTLLAISRENSMFSLTPDEISIIMEKIAQPDAFTYKIIGTSRVGTFKKELAQAASEGFEMIGFTLSYHEQVGLLRRAGIRSPQSDRTAEPQQ